MCAEMANDPVKALLDSFKSLDNETTVKVVLAAVQAGVLTVDQGAQALRHLWAPRPARIVTPTPVVAASTKEFLSPVELAERYGVPLGTIYKWNHDGSGPRASRIGKHARYARAEIERWEATRAHIDGSGE